VIPYFPPPAIHSEATEGVRLPFDKYKFLMAIKMKEGSPGNPYGICDAVRMENRLLVKNGTEIEFALANLKRLSETMPLVGMKVDVMNMALCWKCGLMGALKVLEHYQDEDPGKCAKDLDYAACVNNLYYSLPTIML
jgi:hypothetical protein